MVVCGTAIDKDGKVTYWSVSRHKPSKERQSVSYKKLRDYVIAAAAPKHIGIFLFPIPEVRHRYVHIRVFL